MRRADSRSLAVLAKEVLLYLPAIGGPAVVGVVGLLILTRLLTPSSYGEYAIALATATTGATVLGDWLTPTFIRFYADPDNSERSTLFRHCLLLALVACVIAAVLTFLFLVFAFPLILVASATALCISLIVHKIGLAVLRAKLLTRRYSVVVLIVAVLSLGAGVGSYILTKQVSVLLWSSTVILLGALLPIGRWAGLTASAVRGPVDRNRLRSLMSFGVPIIITAIGGQALLLADRYLLAALSGQTAAGIYIPNYVVAERAMGFAFTPIFAALYPLAARAWAAHDRVTTMRFLDLAQRLFLVGGGFIALFMLVFGERVGAWFLGRDFASGGSIIGLVALGNLFWFGGILFHQPLELDKRTRTITIQTLTIGALNIGLNLAMIPRFGLMGAAWATLLAYVAYAAVAFIWTKRTMSLEVAFPLATLARVSTFGLGMWAAWSAVQSPGTPWMMFGFASGLLYIAWLLITREPLTQEVRSFLSARKERLKTPL